MGQYFRPRSLTVICIVYKNAVSSGCKNLCGIHQTISKTSVVGVIERTCSPLNRYADFPRLVLETSQVCCNSSKDQSIRLVDSDIQSISTGIYIRNDHIVSPCAKSAENTVRLCHPIDLERQSTRSARCTYMRTCITNTLTGWFRYINSRNHRGSHIQNSHDGINRTPVCIFGY
ncbi:hypothetical protein D3C86_1561860 [compost metagenome]